MKKHILLLLACGLIALNGCSKESNGTSESAVAETARVNNATAAKDNTAITISNNLVVYTSRNEQLVQPLFDAYSKAMGTHIEFVTDKAEPLIQKLKAEGELTPADLFITVDAGNLSRAAKEGLLLSVPSGVLSNKIPANLRDPNDQWFGLSQRARTIIYSPERVQANELSTYEDLASEKWKGRLCLRTSKKVYNQSLVAMLIAKHGEEKTEEIVKGWIANLATDPFSNDTKAMEAVIAGQCDATIVNTYYFGRLLKKDPETPLKVFWPNQQASDSELSGVHVNVSGAAVLKHAKHPTRAVDFLEWMISTEAQEILAHGNMEYSVTMDIKQHPIVSAWGGFISDEQSIAKAGELQPVAVRLMDRAGYL